MNETEERILLMPGRFIPLLITGINFSSIASLFWITTISIRHAILGIDLIIMFVIFISSLVLWELIFSQYYLVRVEVSIN